MTRADVCEQMVATEVPILLYHSIADHGPAELTPYRVSPRAFREQLQYLRRHGFYSVTLPEWAACMAEKRPLPGRPVILTFDDGYKDFFENAWPALQRVDYLAAVFVVTDKVGRVADWDAHSSKPLALMSWRELRTLSAKGIAIGSHSASHKDLSILSAEQIFSEGDSARRILRDKLGTEVQMIAFPWGRCNSTVQSILTTCGYTIGLTTNSGHCTFEDDPLNLPRIQIFSDDDIDAFARKVQGKDPQLVAIETERHSDTAPIREPVFYNLVEATVARGKDMLIHPDYARTLASQLDALVGEFVKLQNQLLNIVGAPVTLQKKLTMLFGQPVTGKTNRAVLPGNEISPKIRLNFDDTAQVILSIEPKIDHALSPVTYLNTIRLDFNGPSEWLSLEVDMEWSDLSLAERFQLSLYAQPSRSLDCQAALRFPRKSGPPLDITFTTFELRGDDRNVAVSGDLAMPDFIELDTARKPQLLFFFDATTDLSMVIHYMNVYFA